MKKKVNLRLLKIFKFSVSSLFIFEKCVGKLIKGGNRFFIHKILLSVLRNLKIKSEIPILLFYEFLNIIKPLVAAKWMSKGFGHKAEYFEVPYVASGCFQTKLALKWIYVASKNNSSIGLKNSLYDEIVKVVKGSPSYVLSLKQRLYVVVLKNRASADFKW